VKCIMWAARCTVLPGQQGDKHIIGPSGVATSSLSRPSAPMMMQWNMVIIIFEQQNRVVHALCIPFLMTSAVSQCTTYLCGWHKRYCTHTCTHTPVDVQRRTCCHVLR